MKPMWPAFYRPMPMVTGGDVLRYVARRFRVTVDQLTGESRAIELVHARAAAASIFSQRGNSEAMIARILHRDRTSIRHTRLMLPKYVSVNPLIAEVIEAAR